MTKFVWHLDSENYLSNPSKHADKMPTKHFVDKVCKSLDYYSKNYSLEDIKANKLPNCHCCSDLPRKGSKTAKRLVKHLESINTKLGSRNPPVFLGCSDILQLKIRDIANKPEYRCYGYVIPCENIFHLVFLDPDHETYKE